MQIRSSVRVLMHRRWQVPPDAQLDLGAVFRRCAARRSSFSSQRARARLCEGRPPRACAPRWPQPTLAAYFSQSANVALVQPSPEFTGAAPSALPP